ncbi:MAG: 3-oxoacyl-[acyl-carrier-protein] reductase [Candidatus Omnitrophota bacterium]|nr:MAG: 3-oxoacyl-[acyl-carrier-protein] reductase [Candidatus Omnitrophota bacterium]RKY46535.1 MAG: 3-oxoacyl-[acyl-carrier-protein] reductase [Candidatus Omnitrophota bacterium]HDN86527.1 3-oxoacyl-[acyl-carrier-protein] reductase [Candidatus Omnitrophota bacterium]
MEFRERVAIVTGGAQGIGKEISKHFLNRGVCVAVFDVNSTLLTQVKEELNSPNLLTFCVDVTKLEEVENNVNKVIDKAGKVDILVNNAGITRDNLILRLSEEDWDKVLEVNLKGAFNCTKAVLRYMVKQRYGKIINISSIIGLIGNVGQANYGASKAGLIGFTKSLAKELGSRNICINCVAPGFIKTAMTDRLSDKVKEKMLERIPLNRFGTPTDVAGAVLFLASSLADYITGQVLVVDGGMS